MCAKEQWTVVSEVLRTLFFETGLSKAIVENSVLILRHNLFFNHVFIVRVRDFHSILPCYIIGIIGI